MKFFGRFARVVFFGGVIAVSASAQLVHLSFRDPNNSILIRANAMSVPFNHTGGVVSRFDVFYDIGQAIGSDGAYRFTDPTRSFWRARVETHAIGSYEIIRPLESLYVWDNTLSFTHFVAFGRYEELDFVLNLPDFNLSGLPVPPVNLGEMFLSLSGGRSYFDVPELAEGYGGGGFYRSTARIVDSPVLNPVPEPSTYALGALVILIGTVARGKLRVRISRKQ